MSEAVEAARAMARSEDVFLPDQFSNPANPEAHRRRTGPEIEHALDGRVDALVAGVGTGGTITGVGEYLRERKPAAEDHRGRARSSAVLSGGQAGLTASRVGADSSRRCSIGSCSTRSSPSPTRTPSTPPGTALGGWACSPESLAEHAVGVLAGRGPPRVCRSAHRRDHARLGRAYISQAFFAP